MANPGIGYRRAIDLAAEISLHLLQPLAFATLAYPVAAGAAVTAQLSSTAHLYAGVQVLIGTELITVSSVTATSSPPGPAIVAGFSQSHAAGERVWGPTFPLQAATDPLYTQAEILSYLARAQNQFLLDAPLSFALSTQTISYGQLYQTAPAAMIEMERVAVSTLAIPLSALARAGNVVTADSISAHGFAAGDKLAIFAADAAFNGSFQIATVPSPARFTYAQYAADATASTPGMVGRWQRLWETSQEALSMTDPSWRQQHLVRLQSWWEDRAGSYRWGVNGIPASDFPVELVYSQRDSDTLALSDGFLVPDTFLHIVKYKALEYAASKQGECHNPLLAAYASMRYKRGVMAARRWLGAHGIAPFAAVNLSGLQEGRSRRG